MMVTQEGDMLAHQSELGLGLEYKRRKEALVKGNLMKGYSGPTAILLLPSFSGALPALG